MKLLTTTGIVIFENDKPTFKETLIEAINSGIKNFDHINLSDQTLSGIDLSGLSLNGAYFKRATITDSNLQGSSFEWADFTFSLFQNCNFSRSLFVNPYFTSASFVNCQFMNAKIKGQQLIIYEAAVFSGSDMTGIQIFNMSFSNSDFGNVLMNQSILHSVNFEKCFLTGLTMDQSELHSVQTSCSSGSATVTNTIMENTCDIEAVKKMDLEFLPDPFVIEPDNKLTIYRFNYGTTSPFVAGHEWNYSSKAVRTKNGLGIYGYLPETPGCIWITAGYMFSAYANDQIQLNDNRVILKLEIDKTKILYNGHETAYSEANIIEIVPLIDFISQNYPQYAALLELYNKALENPEIYRRQFMTEYAKHEIELKRFNNESLTMFTGYDLQESQFQAIKQFALTNSKTSEIHGVEHWENVEKNGILLAEMTGANLQVVRAFAYLHDFCRLDDGEDIDHGLRASQLIKDYSGTLLRDVLTEEEIGRLCFAVANHSRMLHSGNITIDTCWDADRLDLPRVGITPLPECMATEAGAYYAANPGKLKIALHG
jgi:uncharacterized protein